MNFSGSCKNFLFFLTLVPAAALASITSFNGQYSVGLDMGLARPTNIGRSTVFPLGFSTYLYGSNTSDIDSLFTGISVSKTLKMDSPDILRIGVSAHYISGMNAEGNLQQGISPPYYPSKWSYSIDSFQYLLDVKWSRPVRSQYFPYIYLGLGMASNRAYDYATTIPDWLTATPEYKSHTTHSFAWSLGLGVDYSVMPRLSLGFGYRFMNLGKVGLGPGFIQGSNAGTRLTQPNLYNNIFLAQLNYFI